MTMVAACRFRDGAVIIADSRATWLPGGVPLYQDSLQKILYLSRRMTIGFAGDVGAAGLVVQQLRIRMRKRSRLQIPAKLAGELPRIAKHYYSLYRTRTGRDVPLELLLAGVSASGKVEIWSFQSPLFDAQKLTAGSVVLGSGVVISSYLQENIDRFDRDLPNLKARADALLSGLDGELQRKGIADVGGLLQVLLVEAGGIRPLRYGFMNLDPEGPARAKSMEMKAGRWIQRDLPTTLEVRLGEPVELLLGRPTELRVQDFRLPPGQADIPKWHLTYFVTCLAVHAETGTIEFRGVMSGIASPEYPISFRLLAAIGLWGSVGDHEVEFTLTRGGAQEQVHRERIHIEFLPEEVDLAFEISLDVPTPGPAFLECRIGGQLLGRRALYFGQPPAVAPSSEAEFAEHVRRYSQVLIEEQRASVDPVLEDTGDSTLVYFSLCQHCEAQDTLLRFERQIMSVYSKSYPLRFPVVVASGFRMPTGEHRLRLELVNAATREVSPITTATVTSTSSCIVAQVQGELAVLVPGPGIYFVNLYVDDRLVGTALLPAETDRPVYSYTLPPADATRVSAGEVLVLLKRARLEPAT